MTLTAGQLAMRREGVTSTDIAAICGLNPYRTPLAVYLDKIGRPLEVKESDAMYWGNALEDDVIQRFRETHPQWEVWGANDTHQNHERPWMLATPDGHVEDGSDVPPPLEVKVVISFEQVRRWGKVTKAPEEYVIQCHWEAGVLNADKTYLAPLLGTYHGLEYREFTIRRDEALLRKLIEIGERFLIHNVGERIPPPPSGFIVDFAALRALHPDVDRDIRQATAEEAVLLDELAVAEDWAKERDKLKQRAMAAIGDAYGIESEDHKAIWYASGESRTFRLLRKGESP